MSAKARLALVAGQPSPLGATWDGQGVNFALFSAHAEGVELCVFDGQEMRVLPLPHRSDQVWHGYLAGAAPGLRYAYRVQGAAAPENGQRFAAERLLLDPYAREVVGDFSWPTADEPAHGLQCSVVDEHFDWAGDAPPATPWADTVLHEVHVKGISQQHPDVPEKLRGTYAGLASPAMIAHFQRLGVTAVSLLPVHHFLDEQRLVGEGRVNYWGYNSLAFFAPEPRYAARIDGQSVIAEFKSMVRTLHAAGLEVISTWSSTTPPKPTSSDRRCPFAASTTRATTCCRQAISPPTKTTVAAAIPSTSPSHASCNW
jgi:glycogen debranching enzyme GlgX